MIYLNWKGPQGRETVDELDPHHFPTRKAFREEVSRMIGEYRMSGMNVYSSSRPCRDWNDR